MVGVYEKHRRVDRDEEATACIGRVIDRIDIVLGI